jgi:glycosyltransferase involved in cell wall biosynthesis
MTLGEESVKVSIIITCYNLENYVKDAITSLLNQVCNFSFEIIVIDDASTDRSKEVIAAIKDPRIQFISLDKNVGAAEAINICFSKATGKYVCRFDADDKWYPHYLQKAADILDNNPDIVLVHSDVTYIDQHDNITSTKNNINRPVTLKAADFEFEHILLQYYINAPAIMARKSQWDAVMPWPERFKQGLGDWFLTLCMLEKNKSYFIDEPLAYYRIHTSNMHRAMVRNKTAEINTAWILDFFQNRKNGISKTKWNHIRFEQNKQLGFAYFFHDMNQDAARCLTRAVKLKPAALVDMQFFRIWLACHIGKKTYNKLKSYFVRGAA